MNKTFAILATLAALSTGAFADAGSNGESRYGSEVTTQSVIVSADESNALAGNVVVPVGNSGSNGEQRYSAN